MKSIITIKNLKKNFNQKEVLQDISFKINEGDIVALIGPNGCGKTTILNILSKLIESDGGEFKINDFKQHDFSYIFQSYRDSLLPWKNIHENIAFPLKLQKKSNEEIERTISEIKQIFNLKIDLKRYPYELSGGQQQTVSFIRALINKPKILFIDEPFSALDYENNLLIRKCLQEYHLRYKPTVLIITHNIEEATHLANKIVIFSRPPTKIIKIIPNKEPYPRPNSFLKSEGFNKIKDEVLDAFQIGVNL